jgi:serine/threonine-protein kinase RIO1
VQLDGFWPTLDMLVREIHHNFTLEHGDFHPWNLIVQGAKMYAIDGVEQHTLPDIKHRIACLKSTIYWVCTVMNHRNPAEKSSNTVHVIKRWLQLSVQHVLSERTFNYSGLTAPGLVW